MKPAQRSEQEWTPETVILMWDEVAKNLKLGFKDFCQAVANKVNAALTAKQEECADVMDKHEQELSATLTAERQRREQEIRELSVEHELSEGLLRNQLTAERQLVEWCEVHAPTKDEPIKCCPACEAVNERQRREQAERKYSRAAEEQRELIECVIKAGNFIGMSRDSTWPTGLVQAAQSMNARLLSALAAIEKCVTAANNAILRNDGARFVSAGWMKSTLKSVDLSLLHEHDAEVRKPLVDALEEASRRLCELQSGRGFTSDVIAVIDDALAKVTARSTLYAAICCPICAHITSYPASAEVVKCAQCLRSFQLEPTRKETANATNGD